MAGDGKRNSVGANPVTGMIGFGFEHCVRGIGTKISIESLPDGGVRLIPNAQYKKPTVGGNYGGHENGEPT